MNTSTHTTVGAVAIGRNEGERLVRCLSSLRDAFDSVVYVDSGSSDGSTSRARDLGAEIVDLDLRTPFTAARARNEGFARLMEIAPHVEFVQFVDGDCELREGWAEAAVAHLHANPSVGMVCGRRRERDPDATRYNRVTDIEWDTEVGDARAAGGDVMIRAEVLLAIGGYNAGMIAGEDPEMSLRARQSGWTVERLDREMTWHDAAMTRFGQWLRRQTRAGHAYAEGAYLHGREPERWCVRDVASNLAWGGALPLASIGLAPWTGGSSLLALGLYGVLWARMWRYGRGRYGSERAPLFATFIVLSKPAQCWGVLEFAWTRLVLGKRRGLIEYKSSGAA